MAAPFAPGTFGIFPGFSHGFFLWYKGRPDPECSSGAEEQGAPCPSPQVPAAELQGTHRDQRRRGGAWRMPPGSWQDLVMSTGKPSRGAQNRTREPAIALLALVYVFPMLSCSDGRNNKPGVRTSAFSYLGDHWHLVISLILTFLFRKTGLWQLPNPFPRILTFMRYKVLEGLPWWPSG